MDRTVVLRLPEKMAERFQRGAAAAHKELEDFLVDRLGDVAPPADDDLAPHLQEELRAMESLSDDALWEVARGRFPAAKQRVYEKPLRRNSEGILSREEEATLHALGEEARVLMLRKSHAYLLLKWRGHALPSREEMLDAA